MSEETQRDAVEEALFQMGSLDAGEAAIERIEALGVEAETPALSSAKMNEIVAASLRAAGLETQAGDSPLSTTRLRRWVPWACAAAGAIAAALVLWQAPPRQEEPSVALAPLPSGQLTLGGTARALGDTPKIRAYGPGDMFFAELSFAAGMPSQLVAELIARDTTGAMQSVSLSPQVRQGGVRFEGKIADLLPPGTWTLQVRYGMRYRCSTSNPGGCETLETQVEIIGS
ncbi:MAG: hypothetical protein KUG77_24640 [Nannocystaceae bacterium]|nr:hypothetical protein [Nannocystaceae bacterium]